MDLGLRNKNVLITGSTNGLGKAIAQMLAEEGANVIISGRNEKAAKELAGQIAAEKHVKAVPLTVDLEKKGRQNNCLKKAWKPWEPLISW